MEQDFRAEVALGYSQITGLSTAKGIGTVPAGCSSVYIIPEGQPIRTRDDGTNPTATVGMPFAVGAILKYTASQMAALRFIEQTAGAIINISFYG